jgi:hypothetical protein
MTRAGRALHLVFESERLNMVLKLTPRPGVEHAARKLHGRGAVQDRSIRPSGNDLASE